MDFNFPPDPSPEESKSAAFIIGYSTAETLFKENPAKTDWINPFHPYTDQWMGFEEAVYTFTQK